MFQRAEHMPTDLKLEKFVSKHLKGKDRESLDLSELDPPLKGAKLSQLVVFLNDRPQIKKLFLRHNSINDDDVERLAKLKHIESLDLFNNLVTDRGIELLAKMLQLTSLQIGGNDLITNVDVFCNSSLRTLIANHCNNLQTIDNFIKNTKVEILGLCNCGIIDDDLCYIQDNHFIKELHLSGNKLTSEGIRFLAQNSIIQCLDISDQDVDDQSAVLLSQMPSLEKLNIHGCLIGDEGMVALSRHPKLKTLDASSLNKVTTKTWGKFSDNKILTELDVSADCLRDDELNYFTKMNLKKLLATYNLVTEVGIKHLEASQIENIDLSSLKRIDEHKVSTLFIGFDVSKKRVREENVDYTETIVDVKRPFKTSYLYNL